MERFAGAHPHLIARWWTTRSRIASLGSQGYLSGIVVATPVHFNKDLIVADVLAAQTRAAHLLAVRREECVFCSPAYVWQCGRFSLQRREVLRPLESPDSDAIPAGAIDEDVIDFCALQFRRGIEFWADQ